MCLPHHFEKYTKLLRQQECVSLYIHTPFCVKKCDYCDFYSVPLDSFVTQYGSKARKKSIEQIVAELRWVQRYLPTTVDIPTIYIGGGTPSILTDTELRLLAEPLQQYRDRCREWSFEMNPREVSAERLALLHNLGVQRISLGVQSFSRDLRRRIGRVDSEVDPRKALDLLASLWQGRVSVDLIYGIPGQCIDSALEDIQIAAAYPIDHLSWYTLTYEEGTPLTAARKKIATSPEQEEREAELIVKIGEAGGSLLCSLGFTRYEVSAWARRSRDKRCDNGGSSLASNSSDILDRSMHNMVYWNMGNWIGIGPGGSGTLGYATTGDPVALTNPESNNSESVNPQVSSPSDGLKKDPEINYRSLRIEHGPLEAYLQKGSYHSVHVSEDTPLFGLQFEEILPEERLQDMLIMGLRTIDGVSIRRIYQEFPSFAKTYVDRILKTWDTYLRKDRLHEGYLVLNTRGFLYMDTILRDILREA